MQDAPQRLKLSGVRWDRGAQAILTTRGWDQSERFDEAWALLVAKNQVEVHVLANVIPFMTTRPEKSRPARVKTRMRTTAAGSTLLAFLEVQR